MSIGVGDILKVVVTLAFTDSNLIQNVFSAVIGGAGGPYDDADIVDDADAWLDNMYANLVAQMTNDIDGSQVQVYVYDAVDDDYDEVGSQAWVFNPTSVGESYARGVAALINAKTSDPDVSGKKYMGGFTENNISDGEISAGLLTALAAFAVDWYTPFTGAVSNASWIPGVWSPKHTNLYALSGDFVLPTEAAYQRRRKRGLGI